MSFTNSTPNYGLPQYIGTDKPTYLGDMNTAYSTIDTQMKANADAAAAATSTANTAAATATAASTNATTALNTANSAASEAASATSAAASATSTANSAATDAATALRASAANSIENLAPAYDPTLTYDVGDLVTYIDDQNSGKLYKNIVPIVTPEEFNINKWDDVTTSEVYDRIYKDRTWNVTSGSLESTTYIDVFNFMIANEIKDCKLIRNVGSTYVLNLDEVVYASNNTSIKFSNVNITKTGTVFSTCVAYYESDNTYINRSTYINSNGETSYVNNDADTFSANGTVRLIYK